ncbi:MAG: hypothetical protein GY936_19360, partial [Ignavibacteriae bacterium]|nr:hypothetical protein [Ignavibacteriota bacterium]
PVLFLCYINDLPSVLNHSKIYLYADDAKIYFQFSKDADNSLLLEDIRHVFQWAKSNLLHVSLPKCSILHLGHGNSCADLVSNDILIPNATVVKDLGVWVSNDLKFNSHINKICLSANQMVNLLFLTFQSRDVKFLVQMFKTFIIPKLEYGSEVWCPYLKKDIVKIEQVQRRFTKRLLYQHNFSYVERLNYLKLLCLEERRIQKDLKYT